jgi:UDP-N-acetylmuramoylalanine--D-glutamate ligase
MKLVILGAGESGIGAALLGKQKGFEVFVSDGGQIKDIYKQELAVNNIPFEEGHHSWNIVLEADEIVKSPGIPEKSELMKKVRERGVSVISERTKRSLPSRVVTVKALQRRSLTTFSEQPASTPHWLAILASAMPAR